MGNIIWKHRFLRRTRKLKCPDCGRLTLVPFYNIETNQPFEGNIFGKCDRQNNCNYYRKPIWQDYKRLGILEFEDEVPSDYKLKVHPKVVQKINEEEDDAFNSIEIKEVLSTTIVDYSQISLFRWLCSIWEENKVRAVFQRHMVGYDQRWGGSPVFWYMDYDGSTRSGKVMGYDDKTGKRVKTPYSQVSWLHIRDRQLREIREPTFSIKLCLFGEHLIDHYHKFRVVESEKTAIICQLEEKDPFTLWLAVGGSENILNSIFRVLEGRPVVFHPDKGKAFHKWNQKIQLLDEDIRHNFKISSCLEGTPLPEESDLADYILSKKQQVFFHKV